MKHSNNPNKLLAFNKKTAFDVFMALVDQCIESQCGMSSYDLPDWTYADNFDAGSSPEDTAKDAIENAMDIMGLSGLEDNMRATMKVVEVKTEYDYWLHAKVKDDISLSWHRFDNFSSAIDWFNDRYGDAYITTLRTDNRTVLVLTQEQM